MSPVPAYRDLITLGSTVNGLQSETLESRILSVLCMMASGTAPDGTSISTVQSPLTVSGTNAAIVLNSNGGQAGVIFQPSGSTTWLIAENGGSANLGVYDNVNGHWHINLVPGAGSNGQTWLTSVLIPVQAPTASAPTYVKGAIYFDVTLNKLRVGGATGWETITSS